MTACDTQFSEAISSIWLFCLLTSASISSAICGSSFLTSSIEYIKNESPFLVEVSVLLNEVVRTSAIIADAIRKVN